MASSKVPEGLRYTVEHEWVRDEGDGVWSIGITDYAQDQLGDITFAELPAVGTAIERGQTFGVVESVKTFSDLYAPLSGEVVAVNDAVVEDPASLNEDPYDNGWLIRVRISAADDVSSLLDAAAYSAHLDSVS